ncbi:Hypothetical protein R9X50_00060400 [Acrodontium crateriforme]|uniref:BHLH domain-containing protein n=1 Tax=Acrodontium crateriforme TaxID=150365 RepID=A0AAQ3R520_9PEZI|nr:Hypothetical protein R9X50_00060400 [Acrodontium crateriforme]
MNTSAEQQWSRPEQLDNMSHMATDLDDLGNLFEFGDIDLNTTPSVEPMQYGNHMQQQAHSQQGTHPSTPFDEINDPVSMPTTMAQDFAAHNQYGVQSMEQSQHQYMSTDSMAPQTSLAYSADSIYQPTMQQSQPQQFTPNQQQQQFQFQQQQSAYTPGRNGIPPTPNSFDMHGETGRFMQQQEHLDSQQRFMLEQRYNVRKDDAIVYTPLASPAATPQYNVQSEYTMPGAYFSPLTSPMLHAQRNAQKQRQQGYFTNPSTAPNSVAPSPIDPTGDVDMLNDGMTLPDAVSSQARKPKRKSAAPRSAGPRVKQSPIQKPQQKRKSTTLSSLIPPEEIDSIMSETQQSGKGQPKSAIAHMHATISGSSASEGSISPEPLSEALMGPPPRPTTSRIQSPAITALQQEARNAAGAAATPKSILSRRHPNHSAHSSPMMQQQPQQNNLEFGGLEDLQLPESASGPVVIRPPLTHLDTTISTTSSSGEQTPRMSARKTPKLGPLSSSASAKPPSSVASPSISGSPMFTGTQGSFTKGTSNKPENKNARNGKKRASSVHVSPAIRPRISPSIKPLLPEGTPLNSPTHALLLASKSNYQNLLEGNHLPGVNYPDSLSTGLTSKRTSHKVAEQGRRNRINEALKEMQSLLPKPSPKAVAKDSGSDASPEAAEGDEAGKDSKESKEEAQARSNSSKAATVESANEYIRRLQKENAILQKDFADMKKRLEAHTGTTPESSASPAATTSVKA